MQSGNDAWNFGSNGRNAIVFSSNYVTASGQNVGDIGTEQFSIQHEQLSNSVGFLSSTKGNVPVLMMTQSGNIGLGTTSPVSIFDIQGQVGVSALRLQGGYPYGAYYLDATSYLIAGQGVGYSFNLKNGGFSSNNVLTFFNDKVGIGTPNPDARLTVNGKIKAEEIEVVVDVPADYVFEADYKLMPLSEVSDYIKQNKHLPNVPAAEELKREGWQVGEMNNKLLEKIEELTLYILQIKEEQEKLSQRVTNLEKEK
jgi:hypothetical protein